MDAQLELYKKMQELCLKTDPVYNLSDEERNKAQAISRQAGCDLAECAAEYEKLYGADAIKQFWNESDGF